MLMKMGWEEGKGLGKDEDGSTQLLEVKYKVDNVGMRRDACNNFRIGGDQKGSGPGNLPAAHQL